MDPWLRDRYAGVEPGGETYKRRRVPRRRAAEPAGRIVGPVPVLQQARPAGRRRRAAIYTHGARAWAWFLGGVVVGAMGMVFLLSSTGVLTTAPR